MKGEKDVPQERVRSAEKNMIAGGIAGSFAKTATAPLSRLTILYQVGPILSQVPGSSTTAKITVSDSLWVSFMNIIEKEGFLSLWRGNFTSVIHRFPYSAVNFASYEFAESILSPGHDHHDSSKNRILCGAISGATSCITCYPLDIIRTRITVGTINLKPKTQRIQSKIVTTFVDILENDGVLGLYRGLSASLAVAIPTFALSFTVYGKVKEYMLDGEFFTNRDTGHLNVYGSLLSGSMSGVSSSLVMFPMDVVRKRMQLLGGLPMLDTVANTLQTTPSSSSTVTGSVTASSGRKAQPRGMLSHMQNIYRQGGMKGFYRGIVPELLKVCPMVALTFSSYEIVKHQLDQYDQYF